MSTPSKERPEQIGGIQLTEAYAFLDSLREGNAVNMIGATPHLQEEFSIGRGAARGLLIAWMEDFGEEE